VDERGRGRLGGGGGGARRDHDERHGSELGHESLPSVNQSSFLNAPNPDLRVEVALPVPCAR
jgi:hypothetical protein